MSGIISCATGTYVSDVDEFDHANRGRELYRYLTMIERADLLPEMRRRCQASTRSTRVESMAFLELAAKDLRARGPYRSAVVPMADDAPARRAGHLEACE